MTQPRLFFSFWHLTSNQSFKSNKKEWKAFATRVKKDIEDIQRTTSSIEGYKDIPPVLHEAIDNLTKYDITSDVLCIF